MNKITDEEITQRVMEIHQPGGQMVSNPFTARRIVEVVRAALESDSPTVGGDPVSLTKYTGEDYIFTAHHLGVDSILLEYRYTPPEGRKTTNLVDFNCTLEYREAAALAFMLSGSGGRLGINQMFFEVQPLEDNLFWRVGEYGDTGVIVTAPDKYVKMILHRELAANVLYGMVGL